MQKAADTREHDNLRNALTVISATDHGVGPEMEEIWAGLQDDLATLSDYSRHVISPATGHYLQFENPQLVIDEIVALFARL
ncbi:hypothetical protein [Paenibacillus zanthoxyli]|uniref:hypothetical protein n=1 Tax=Paenibacillus zanthoxyli TaxID=369399 RepID=UPI00046EBAD9|nr:hypothetical protein [Paenibacillus zanthoxyli]